MDKYSTYASGFNCRSYYQCNSRGRSMAMCCKNNESFNPDLGKCVRDITCKIDCTARQFYQAGSRPSYSSFRETQREVQRDKSLYDFLFNNAMNFWNTDGVFKASLPNTS